MVARSPLVEGDNSFGINLGGGSSGSPFGDILKSIKKNKKPEAPKPSPPQPAPPMPKSEPKPQQAPPLFSPPSPRAAGPSQAPPAQPSMGMPNFPQRDYTNLPPMVKKLHDLSQKVMLSDYVTQSKQCDEINKASEKMMEILFKIYSSKVKEEIPEDFFVYLQFCKEASATVKESGKSGSEMHQLNYQLESRQKVFLQSYYGVLVNDRKGNFFGFYISSEDTDSAGGKVRVKSITGWKDLPTSRGIVRAPFDNYEWIEGAKIGNVLTMTPDTESWKFHYQKNRNLPPNITINKYRFEVVTPGTLTFYSSRRESDMLSMPKGCFVRQNRGFFISPEKFSKAVQRGKLVIDMQSTEFANVGCVKGTIRIVIDIPPLSCKTAKNSGKGAVAIAGDCIDHGGYILPSARNIFANGKSVARVGDKVFCLIHGITEIVGDKKSTLYGGKKRIARVGDKTKCGATIIGGSYNIYSGSKKNQP